MGNLPQDVCSFLKFVTTSVVGSCLGPHMKIMKIPLVLLE